MALVSEYSFAKFGATDRLMALASGLATRFQKARAFNKAYNELSALPDAQLRDMGLNRSMIRRMAYQAVYEQ